MLSDYQEYLDKYTVKHRRKVMQCPMCREPNKMYSPYPADENGFPLVCKYCFQQIQTGIQIEKAYSDMELIHLCCQSYIYPGDLRIKIDNKRLYGYQDRVNELIAVMVGGGASAVIRAWNIDLFGDRKRTLLRKRSSEDNHIHGGIKAVITSQESADAAQELVILLEELMEYYGKMKYEEGKDLLLQMARGYLPEGI